MGKYEQSIFGGLSPEGAFDFLKDEFLKDHKKILDSNKLSCASNLLSFSNSNACTFSFFLVSGPSPPLPDSPFISLLTDPTFGGISASFGMLGDINIAEPGALIGFAGPRVIKETIKKDLPPGFQRSEFLLEHGFLDFIIDRKELKNKLSEVAFLFRN